MNTPPIYRRFWRGTVMIEYTLIRSARRTLGLEITPACEVVVRAPLRCSQRQIDRFVAEHRDWIEGKLALQQRRAAWRAAMEPTPEQERELRRQAADVLPQRVAYYAPQMGVSPTGIKITSARTRFGSCNGKNSLCFSWRLMQYPPEAVDYVVVHELAHIRHHNHSRDFWAVVESVLPDYRYRQSLLHPDL